MAYSIFSFLLLSYSIFVLYLSPISKDDTCLYLLPSFLSCFNYMLIIIFLFVVYDYFSNFEHGCTNLFLTWYQSMTFAKACNFRLRNLVSEQPLPPTCMDPFHPAIWAYSSNLPLSSIPPYTLNLFFQPSPKLMNARDICHVWIFNVFPIRHSSMLNLH